MGRAAAREDPIPRAPVEMAKPRGDAGVQVQFTQQEIESRSANESAEEEVTMDANEILLGVVRDEPIEDDDDKMSNGLPEPLQEFDDEDDLPMLQRESDDEGGQAVWCELDSDSDADEDTGGVEPPAKRPREIQALGVAGAIGVLPDEAAAETPQD